MGGLGEYDAKKGKIRGNGKCVTNRRERKTKINGNNSHHVGTEPLLYVIHDRGLCNLWSKATHTHTGAHVAPGTTQQQPPEKQGKTKQKQKQKQIAKSILKHTF